MHVCFRSKDGLIVGNPVYGAQGISEPYEIPQKAKIEEKNEMSDDGDDTSHIYSEIDEKDISVTRCPAYRAP